MPLRTTWTSLLALALLPAAPAVAAQASRVEVGPSGVSQSVGPAGSIGSAGQGSLTGSIGTVPLLAPSLSPAGIAPGVKAPLGAAAPGVSALPKTSLGPVPVLPPSVLAAPAEVPGTAPLPEGIQKPEPLVPSAESSLPSGETAREEAARRFDGSAAAPAADLPDLPGTAAPPAGGGLLLRQLVNDAVKEGRVSGALGKEIKRAAYMDPLTGALNRLYLDEEIDHVLAGHKTLITFKLDWLKEINDSVGHVAGDQFLAETARIVQRMLGPRGLLVRRSPTGFAVFTDLEGRPAELLAEALRAAVAYRMGGRRSVLYDAQTRAPLLSTIQLGVAPISGSYEATLAAAERSRQTAKDAGGDLVADAGGNVLPRQLIVRLRRELRAAGQEKLAARLEAELSRVPRDEQAAPRRRGRRLNDILGEVKDQRLRESVSDFLFRNRLSGLRNRRWLDENMEVLLGTGRVVRYAALDLDRFGDLNRLLGETRADKVLTRFGRILAESAAGRDLTALHLSGEEFCLLLGPGEADVRGLLEAVREKVAVELGPRAASEDGIIAADGRPFRITVSIGEARLSRAALDPLELFLDAGERAEQSLSKAKGSGRNKVVLEGD